MTTSTKKQSTWATIKEMVTLLVVVFLIRSFGFGLYQVPTGSMETTVLVGERFFADKFTVLFSKPQRGDIIAFNEPGTRFSYSSNYFVYLFQKYVWGPLNLTKRVIAVPGDVIKGVVEEGKPVIYLNNKKLDEPYLNKYPLLFVLNDDPKKIEKVVNDEVAQLLYEKRIHPWQVNEAKFELTRRHGTYKSWDPQVAFSAQPFYTIDPKRVLLENGKEMTYYPNTVPHRISPIKREGNNYWGNNSDEFYIELGPDQYWCMGDNRLGSGDSRLFGPVDGQHIHAKILFRIWSIDSDESWWIVDLIKHPIDFFKRIRWSRFFQMVH